jgi:hypothetical protein
MTCESAILLLRIAAPGESEPTGLSVVSGSGFPSESASKAADGTLKTCAAGAEQRLRVCHSQGFDCSLKYV